MGTKFNDFLPFIKEDSAKLFLTLFRLVAIVGLGYWLWDSIKKQGPKLLNLALALIFAGALGNIIDSVFYGVIFTDSYNTVAKLFPEGGGYAPLFYGHVVDMLQFPLVEWTWPKWIPVVGGDTFLFFQYIFNVADTAISSGVGIMIVFNKKYSTCKSWILPFALLGLLLIFISSSFFSWAGDVFNLYFFKQVAKNNFLFIRLGDFFLLLSFFIFFQNRLQNRIWKFLGTNTLSLYIVHYFILYGSLSGFGLYKFYAHQLNVFQTVLGLIFFFGNNYWYCICIKK